MCTMTWFLKDNGYELFFNRDEQVSRSRAELPAIKVQDDLHYISPTDPDAGGTWIAVNEVGLTFCLLNHYEFEQIATYKNWTSRGEIVRDFASIQTLTAAITRFNTLELDNYRAFRMFVIERNGDNALFIWDGHLARVEKNVNTPKSSSSVNAKYVKANRNQYYAELNLINSVEVDDYLRFHRSHSPNKSEQSVCMHRQDANTVSMSQISVGSKTARFAYTDGAPCQAVFEPVIEINLIETTLPNAVTDIAVAR